MFQSSPGPKAECYPPRTPLPLRGHEVSILTRPEGRVLRSCPLGISMAIPVFQSSPGPKAECYIEREAAVALAA